MVNFRFHLISLVAVFLALGIGILMGSTVIDQATVRQLESNLGRIQEQRDAQRRRAEGLDRQLGVWNGFGEQTKNRFFSGRLRAVPVLVVAVDGIDGGLIDSVHGSLLASGANDLGTLVLKSKLSLAAQRDAQDLANMLTTSEVRPDALRPQLLSQLAVSLLPSPPRQPVIAVPSSSPAVGSSAPPGASVIATSPVPAPLGALRQAGFIDYHPEPQRPEALAQVPVGGMRIVVLSGSGAAVPDTTLAVPLCSILAGSAAPVAPVVAAEAGSDDPGRRAAFVGPLRGDGEVAKRLSTVDDLEQLPGLAALVLALQDLGSGNVGHYGVGPGTRLLPPLPI